MEKLFRYAEVVGIIQTIMLSLVCLYFISYEERNSGLMSVLMISWLATHFLTMKDYETWWKRVKDSTWRISIFCFTVYAIARYYKLDNTIFTLIVFSVLSAAVFLVILALEQLSQYIRGQTERMKEEIKKRSDPLF